MCSRLAEGRRSCDEAKAVGSWGRGWGGRCLVSWESLAGAMPCNCAPNDGAPNAGALNATPVRRSIVEGVNHPVSTTRQRQRRLRDIPPRLPATSLLLFDYSPGANTWSVANTDHTSFLEKKHSLWNKKTFIVAFRRGNWSLYMY